MINKHKILITNWLKEGKSKLWIAKQLKGYPEYESHSLNAIRHKVRRCAKHISYNKTEDLTEQETETNQYEKIPILSALKSDGKIMTPEEFCIFYGLDPKLTKSFKLVTHTGTPYYNIASKTYDSDDSISLDDYEKMLSEVIKNITPEKRVISSTLPTSESATQLIFTDVHIGMDPNYNGYSLFGGSWNKEDIEARRKVMVDEFKEVWLTHKSKEVHLINLGDFCDGLDGYTTRRDHKLPQNLDNHAMFDVGVKFMLDLFQEIYSVCGDLVKYTVYNVCESNHSSHMDYFIMRAYEDIIKSKFPTLNVSFINERKFMGHFTWGNHVEILTHGKDSEFMKTPLPPVADARVKSIVDSYLKQYIKDSNLTISVSKGDSHLDVVDKRIPEFNYHSYMAFSPASGWVQNNFNQSRSGFTIKVKDSVLASKEVVYTYEFEWGKNILK